jgi:hypothetical protein
VDRRPPYGPADRGAALSLETFIELITVVDPAEAAESAFGRWVASGATLEGRQLGWVVRTDDIDGVAKRLGLEVAAKSRKDASGRTLSWRVAGIEEAAADPSLPFFVEWGDGTPHPGRAPITHPAGAVEIASLELDADRQRLANWLGSDRLPITVREGDPAVASVLLSGAGGEFTLA